jgi:hypothetical protein
MGEEDKGKYRNTVDGGMIVEFHARRGSLNMSGIGITAELRTKDIPFCLAVKPVVRIVFETPNVYDADGLQ